MRVCCNLRASVILAIAGIAAAGVGAQDVDTPTPTFRSEINYVQLPVRVLDADGQFVSGLTQTDFQVLEDGKLQTISAFSAVDIPFIPADSTVPAAPIAQLDAVASNEAPQVDGRAYLFVLDDFSAEAGDTLKVRNLMHGFIRERLSANDLAAITIVGGARSQNFTRNRQLLHDAVDRFIGDRDDDTQMEMPETEPVLGDLAALRRQQTLNGITRMAEWLGSIKGRRKSLVLITSSPICSLASNDCREPLQHALRVTMQSDVSIYVLDPRGLDTSRRSRPENSNPNATLTKDGYSEASNDGSRSGGLSGDAA